MNSCFNPNLFTPERKLDELALGELRVPVPENELERLRFLRETQPLDSQVNEDEYLRFISLATRVFKVPIALVSLIDVSRQWFKARIGLDAPQTPRNDSFCSYAIMEREDDVFVVHDATQDPRFRENPLVLGHPHIRFYAGASFRLHGIKVGTVCIIDRVPRSKEEFSTKEKKILHDIAAAVGSLVEERHRGESEDKKILATRVLCGMDKSLAVLNDKKSAIERSWIAYRMSTAANSKAALSDGAKSTQKTSSALSMLAQSVEDFALSLSTTEQQLEMRMKIAQSLFICDKTRSKDKEDDEDSPTMSLCSFPRMCAWLKSFVPRLHISAGIEECSWLAPLQEFAQTIASQRILSFPELFSLLICELTAHNVVCAGAAFDALAVALETKKTKAKTRAQTKEETSSQAPSEGNILLSFSYRLESTAVSFSPAVSEKNVPTIAIDTAAVRLHNLSQTVQSLEHLLRWIGGSLSVSVPVRDEEVFLVVVRLPFTSVAADERETTNAAVKAAAKHFMENVLSAVVVHGDVIAGHKSQRKEENFLIAEMNISHTGEKASAAHTAVNAALNEGVKDTEDGAIHTTAYQLVSGAISTAVRDAVLARRLIAKENDGRPFVNANDVLRRFDKNDINNGNTKHALDGHKPAQEKKDDALKNEELRRESTSLHANASVPRLFNNQISPASDSPTSSSTALTSSASSSSLVISLFCWLFKPGRHSSAVVPLEIGKSLKISL